ncbi:hypothetical protein [Streptomyces sp. NPDC051214]|uniref:hypothetical protein n=1 Tax=Streptomyces sp. NPDC051214 TaxID=3155282 RepID=UPI00344659D8
MEITGHSSDFIVDASLPAAMKNFVMRQHRHWPGMFLYGEPAPADFLAEWNLPEVDADDAYPGIVTFSAGQEMEDFWEENGYALNSDGEGPFSVFYGLRPQPLRAAHTVSLITPDDPATDPFSARVLRDFVESFGSGACETAGA